MNIEKLIKENYRIAKSKGFYPEDSKIEDHLMGIVSEIGEAYEAHRGGNSAPIDWAFENITPYQYTKYLSGTFEDEIADIFIRLFNLCGWLVTDIEKDFDPEFNDEFNNSSVRKKLFLVSTFIVNRNIDMTYYALVSICKHHNIPIEKHIQAKMEYNKTREYLHGKEY